MVTLERALEIVIELAEQNVIDDRDMKEQAKEQRQAIRRVGKLLHGIREK